MIVLKALTTPIVRDFTADGFPGVSVTLRRLTSAEIETARAEALKVVQRLREGDDALALYGLAGRDVNGQRFNAADRNQMFRLGTIVAAVEQALLGFVSWTGFADETGRPAPIDRQTLTIVMADTRFYSGAMEALAEASRLLDVEKKDATPSPDGSSAAPPDRTAAASPIAGAAP